MPRLLRYTVFACLLPIVAQGGEKSLVEGGESIETESVYLDSEPSLFDAVPFRGYFDWKKQLKEDTGLTYGFNAYVLPQWGTESPQGTSDAFSGVYRFMGSWTLTGRESGNPGRIEFRIENRSAHGGSLSPTDYGNELGMSALNPGFIYNDNFDTDVSVLNWTQIFTDSRWGFAVGRLAFDVYQDSYFLQTISGNLLNRAFVVSPSIGTTGIGALGAVVHGFVNNNFWLGGQAYDANAANGDFDLDTVKEGEWLTNVEFGWTPDFNNFKRDRVLLTYWNKDARELAGAPSGHGWTLSASHAVSEQLIPFLRLGYSNGGGGAPARESASLGFQYSPRKSQSLAIGLGWAQPSDKALREEYVLEAGYKVQVTPQLSLMPDLQYLIDPANNPEQDSLWIFSLRMILAL